jgi:hypothetical protein
MKWNSLAKMLYPVGFEAIGFQETFVFALDRMMRERNTFFMIEPIKRRTASKDERILRLVPRVKNGFYLPRHLIITPYSGRGASYNLTQKLTTQLLMFPFAQHDDVADATADQLEIVQTTSAARTRPQADGELKGKFIHPSILEDKRNRRKLPAHAYDVVR